MKAALGLIEAIGLTSAVAALDAASKAADVKLVGYEKVIGVDKVVSVTIQIAGEVAAVKAGVEAGVAAANKIGRIVSSHVIPRPHEEVEMLIKIFEQNLKDKKAPASNPEVAEKPQGKTKKQEANK
ncbi:BMC domain-containing protein [Alkaliphilus serpentinus]|uniref:BMC domain-containing protein n=1 Tax=Alkaliphilus serpentinus TaxID=1482731 RepID=A0A833HP94_9FIRM|nr:BMC domain-containing protein [Alkaliphilus serpentinus]